MRAEAHSARLVRPLDELGGILGGLLDKGVVVIFIHVLGLLEGANEGANGRKLDVRVGNILFVDDACLGHKLV